MRHGAARITILMVVLLLILQGSALAATPDTVALVDPSQGQWHYLDAVGNELGLLFFGNPGDYPIMGDWDCDGDDTPGMYRQSDGYVYLRNSNSQGIADIRFFFGNPGDVPIVGDFNGDGCDTVAIYRPSEARFYVINALGKNDGGLGAADFDFLFGNPGDKPFVGDFNGDGIDTIGLHRETTGFVYFRNSLTTGIADSQFFFGDPGDRLVAGDWNNNGSDTPALFRPSNTTMYFRFTNTQGNADNQFPAGQSGWIPVAGIFGTITAPPPPPPPPFTFGSGTWRVGVDIPANRYRNSGYSGLCYWERLSGFSGQFGDLITNGADTVRQIVDVEPTDAGFSTNASCGTWSTDLTPLKSPPAPVTAGTWLVGSEVAPGRWRNTGFSDSCYWERLSGFNGQSGDRITNGLENVRQIVDIEASDTGFYTDTDCGTWTQDLSPLKSPTSNVTGGTWLVATEVAPGSWRNTPADTGCYWERLSGFSDESADRITNDYITDLSQTIVTIASGDTGFFANEACGVWTYLGP